MAFQRYVPQHGNIVIEHYSVWCRLLRIPYKFRYITGDGPLKFPPIKCSTAHATTTYTMEITFVNVDQTKAERRFQQELKEYAESQQWSHMYAEKTEDELNAVVGLLMLSCSGRPVITADYQHTQEKRKANASLRMPPHNKLSSLAKLSGTPLVGAKRYKLKTAQGSEKAKTVVRQSPNPAKKLLDVYRHLNNNNNHCNNNRKNILKEETTLSKPSLLLSCRNMLKEFLKTVDTGCEAGSL